METKKINYSLLVTIAITIIGWSVSFGVNQNKIEQNSKEITRLEKQHETDVKELKEKQNQSDVILNSINMQLAELNAKVTLLLDGKVVK